MQTSGTELRLGESRQSVICLESSLFRPEANFEVFSTWLSGRAQFFCDVSISDQTHRDVMDLIPVRKLTPHIAQFVLLILYRFSGV